MRSHSTAKKDGAAFQAELLERICGHMSTHHDGGLSVFIAHQVWTGIPPKVRKLASHIILYPQRIAKDSVGHIARGCLLSKGQLEPLMWTGVMAKLHPNCDLRQRRLRVQR